MDGNNLYVEYYVVARVVGFYGYIVQHSSFWDQFDSTIFLASFVRILFQILYVRRL